MKLPDYHSLGFYPDHQDMTNHWTWLSLSSILKLQMLGLELTGSQLRTSKYFKYSRNTPTPAKKSSSLCLKRPWSHRSVIQLYYILIYYIIIYYIILAAAYCEPYICHTSLSLELSLSLLLTFEWCVAILRIIYISSKLLIFNRIVVGGNFYFHPFGKWEMISIISKLLFI